MRLNLYRRRRGGQGAVPAGPLQRIAPSWFYAPVRRAIQAVCLAAFVAMFLWACRPYAPAGSPVGVDGGRMVDPATFLMLDPLVSVLAAVAGRGVVPGLVVAAGVLLIGLVFARGFCGYVCPMGAVIDLFDWALGRRVNRGRSLIPRGPWVHARYYLLAAALVAAAAGVQVAGFLAPIPILTRGLQFIISPLQAAWPDGWKHLLPIETGRAVSLGLFALVLILGVLAPRFWCRYLCPTGALIAAVSWLRLT
jgi:polyferredoxin